METVKYLGNIQASWQRSLRFEIHVQMFSKCQDLKYLIDVEILQGMKFCMISWLRYSLKYLFEILGDYFTKKKKNSAWAYNEGIGKEER